MGRAGERMETGHRADPREKHVLLRIPWVALRAEEFIRALADGDGGAPLDQFVDRADREAHRRHDDKQPAAAREPGMAQQQVGPKGCLVGSDWHRA